MPVQLAPEHERIIEQQMTIGRFQSPGEVLDAALRLLEENELLREYRRQRMLVEVDAADEQASRGKVRQFDAEEMIQRIRNSRKEKEAKGRSAEGASV